MCNAVNITFPYVLICVILLFNVDLPYDMRGLFLEGNKENYHSS